MPRLTYFTSTLFLAVIITMTPSFSFAQVEKGEKEITPQKDEFIEIDEEPVALNNIQQFVVYPPNAQRTGIQGKITVSVLIGKDGAVEKVEVDRTDHEWFIEPAVNAMKLAKFSPARSKGEPVKVWYTQTIHFKLDNAEEVVKNILDSQRAKSPRGVIEAPSDRDLSVTKKPKLIDGLKNLPPGLQFPANENGDLVFRFLIGKDGEVLEVTTEDPALHSQIPKEFWKAAHEFTFEPGEINNSSTMMWTHVMLTVTSKK